MVTYLGSPVQLCCGREEHCEQISLVCVGSAHSVWATLGLPPLMVCILSWSTLLRLQVALQGNCLKWVLGCVHFPGLSHSGGQVLGECTLPRWASESYHLPRPSRWVSWVCSGSAFSGVPCVSSGELISGCDPPGGCQLSRIPGRLGEQLGACLLWGRVCPLLFGSGWRLPAFLPPVGDGPVRSWLALLWYSLSPLFCEWASSALG